MKKEQEQKQKVYALHYKGKFVKNGWNKFVFQGDKKKVEKSLMKGYTLKEVKDGK